MPVDTLFKSLTQEEKDRLPTYILAAQKALLNPGSDWRHYAALADSIAAGSSSFEALSAEKVPDTLKFTRNVVVLEITGAEMGECKGP